jgi:hypothetical protein
MNCGTTISHDEIVIAKKLAAEEWCKEKGLQYKLHDPGTLSHLDMQKLCEEGVVILLS